MTTIVDALLGTCLRSHFLQELVVVNLIADLSLIEHA